MMRGVLRVSEGLRVRFLGSTGKMWNISFGKLSFEPPQQKDVVSKKSSWVWQGYGGVAPKIFTLIQLHS